MASYNELNNYGNVIKDTSITVTELVSVLIFSKKIGERRRVFLLERRYFILGVANN